MRLSFFLALVVATFVATCVSFTSAENVAHIRDAEHETSLKTSRELSTADEWWLPDALDEERVGGSFMSKLGSKVSKIRNGGTTQTKTLSDAQLKSVTREVATNVKKDRKIWPKVKTGLKILYGALLATLIIVGVEAMLSQKNF
ncbi:RxLR effector protein cre9 [Phytophthora oleae]|uniref:RxLR effector protein cre9 n=1 Tax=Phytophthora oleae TaxID=2107226 RepID=A0ABD3FVR3_9STRA